MMKKMKTMKCILNTIILSLSMTLMSCGDFLEIKPQDVITVDDFWNEKSDVENAIAACYSAMTSYGFLSRMMIWGLRQY